MENLSLTKDEEEELILVAENIDPGLGNIDLCLVGRFLTDRSVNFNVMRQRMASVWRPVKGVCIMDIGSQRYLFQFFHKIDL